MNDCMREPAHDPNWEVTVTDTNQRRTDGADFILLDCRRADERTEAHIEDSLFVPMDEIPARLEMLREFEEHSIVVYCRSGQRSLSVAAYLRQQGFDEVFSMAGGIIGWQKAGFAGLILG